MTPVSTHPRVAVIGSGVAGLVAAYACTRGGAEVTLFEADERLGGHADTHVVREGERELHIDTGFIVHNRRTYPTLLRLFEELGVETQRSEMSMSIADESTQVEWAGARGVRGVLPTWRRLTDRDHLRMLVEIPRFHRQARRLLSAGDEDDSTLADFLAAGGFSAYFVRHFMEPLVAAVWSCEPSLAGEYPARYLFAFLAHHGILSVTGSPTWRTVTGGSHAYVRRVAEQLHDVRLGTPVVAVEEEDDHVVVRDATGRADRFDRVVIATHPHQTLAMLPSATPEQKDVLGAITYVPNIAVLHTDTTLLPRNGATHGSWNFRRRADQADGVTVTYDLTRLQRLDTSTRYLVTLGAEDLVDPATVIARMPYEHPLYTPASVAAQRRLLDIETDRVAFAGAYHGWGFHEDGARSGAAAAQRLGFDWAPSAPAPWSRQVFATTVTHVRRQPWRRTFTHRSSMWVTEVGHGRPPRRLRDLVLGTIEPRDHLGDPSASLRENLTAFLAARGVDLPADARVRLAAHPRALGFCFNPISVFWCSGADGAPIATVVEVHNTYGDRHAYLLRPGEGASVAKQMYVSPFHGVDGRYDVHTPEPTDELHVSVALHTPDGAAFSAGLVGQLTERHHLAAALDGVRDALRIRRHGIALWLRRLPIQPRPDHHQEGVRP